MQLLDLYQKHLLPVLKKALQEAVSMTPEVVRDELRFCQAVADPAWASLPLPLRKAGREKVRWDLFLLASRKEVFLIQEGAVTLRGDAEERLLKLARQMFGTAAPAPSPVTKPMTSPAAKTIKAAKPVPSTEPKSPASRAAAPAEPKEVAVG